MAELDRRQMLLSTCAVVAAGISPLTAQAAAQSATGAQSVAPRERLLFDFDWKFTFGHGTDPTKDLGFGFGQADFSKTGKFEFAKLGFKDENWTSVNLPHDWAVELPFVHDDAGEGDAQLRSHGYKPLGRRYPETSVGWYRREFAIPASDQGRRIWVEFDGAFRDVLVFVNGCFIGRNTNGYTPFRFDVTDFLAYGAQNVIAVRVDATYGDGWFYEGAGLYRHVWLTKMDALHVGQWESVVNTELAGDTAVLALRTTVVNSGASGADARVKWTIIDPAGTVVASAEAPRQAIAVDGMAVFTARTELTRAALWAPGTPNLYSAVVSVERGDTIVDADQVSFGIRHTRFDPDRGFFLNGQHVKLQGVCNHQDHAGVGVALPDRLQRFRVGVMQDMGCNAIRTSHNMPTPELVEACDRMGMMMLCETRQMSSNPEGMAQLDEMIKRYRNSPAIIGWSIGNEEFLLQKDMAEQGAKISATMVRRCHELDPTRLVTVAVNSDNKQGVSDPVDLIGFNYVQWFPDGFHKDNPGRPVFGSETSSAVSTRGEYRTDPSRNVMSSYDGVVPWGQTPEDWWKFQMEREWEAGGFAWTGFDYRGEPTPYNWPSISSQFGIVDMCGFPKDYFYYYKAWWAKAPALHLFPHWNWEGREGTEVPVWVYSNADEVELLVNGKSLGRKAVPRFGHVEWKATYAPGFIEARAFTKGKRILTQRRDTTGKPAAIKLSVDRSTIYADGEDVAIFTVEALDKKGRAVPVAGNKIAFKVSGPGKLIGVGNGDPNCLESDKSMERSLFNGLAQVIVQGVRQAGKITLEAVSADGSPDALIPARLSVTAQAVPLRPSVT
ncbi:beta-galactosidase GalA [Asticcacaulis sp. 201]|uniref:beta-galactosidase GalA n=1 Tax=Asticcacaulis sp. 201 TaxID=3028787 RepID=UPI0029167B13|nr:beta-galactosidase GalA [Asticcacaulis sp. 201]MDV6332937.1 beta-galactosidase GalA [Asticcacaulis sp. 201]